MNTEIDIIKGIHPGLFLERKIREQKLIKSKLALNCHEYPQTLNAITKGKRDMNTTLSLKLEKALGLEEGYLMTLQVFYEIKEVKRKQNNDQPDLKQFRKILFWDTKIESLNWKEQYRFIINRIFERGNEKEKNIISSYYGTALINEVLSKKGKILMHWNTVTPLLKEVLEAIMGDPVFEMFRLVGGTSLSLQIGHRESVDIDLFTDAQYASLDFDPIHKFFYGRYVYVETNRVESIGMGTSYFVGPSADDAVKVDVYYTDAFIRQEIDEENIRLCSIEDIIAMKLEIISTLGRRKDFWDLHALHRSFSIENMIALYTERYPYGSTEKEIRAGLINFSGADDEPDPICLLGKHWELIKLDFVEWLS